jgi:hypothetical protein
MNRPEISVEKRKLHNRIWWKCQNWKTGYQRWGIALVGLSAVQHITETITTLLRIIKPC